MFDLPYIHLAPTVSLDIVHITQTGHTRSRQKRSLIQINQPCADYRKDKAKMLFSCNYSSPLPFTVPRQAVHLLRSVFVDHADTTAYQSSQS